MEIVGVRIIFWCLFNHCRGCALLSLPSRWHNLLASQWQMANNERTLLLFTFHNSPPQRRKRVRGKVFVAPAKFFASATATAADDREEKWGNLIFFSSRKYVTRVLPRGFFKWTKRRCIAAAVAMIHLAPVSDDELNSRKKSALSRCIIPRLWLRCAPRRATMESVYKERQHE